MICNKFKPERCHHCSTCGRCVLVMDHHCPWLNNCVGFRNRKVFMLLIIYAFTLSVVGLLYSIFPLTDLIIRLVKGDTSHSLTLIFGLIGYGLTVVFFIIMILFLQTHFDLINQNMTTIEQLDEKRGNIRTVTYDMGKDFNYQTVFGRKKACWGCPLTSGESGPFGDGTVFTKTDLSNRNMDEPAVDDNPYFEDDAIFDDGGWNDQQPDNPLLKINEKYAPTNPLSRQI